LHGLAFAHRPLVASPTQFDSIALHIP
jgi:hypothetical protein